MAVQQHLRKQGMQKSFVLSLHLSSSENTSFMVTAYFNYYVPCLSWLQLCRLYLQGPSCEISVMCMSYLTWSSRNYHFSCLFVFLVILPLYNRQDSLTIKMMSYCPLICESNACKTAFQKKLELNLQEQSHRKCSN